MLLFAVFRFRFDCVRERERSSGKARGRSHEERRASVSSSLSLAPSLALSVFGFDEVLEILTHPPLSSYLFGMKRAGKESKIEREREMMIRS